MASNTAFLVPLGPVAQTKLSGIVDSQRSPIFGYSGKVADFIVEAPAMSRILDLLGS